MMRLLIFSLLFVSLSGCSTFRGKGPSIPLCNPYQGAYYCVDEKGKDYTLGYDDVDAFPPNDMNGYILTTKEGLKQYINYCTLKGMR